ncbi:threonine-phosphate decarboxylase [Oscillatoriales cyanobacterium LEGE 11467]|uniref:threonine-phosphate decarboxylase n=1 Tax=Zarconia navalis LEGE 11467 TaxID=1828826 RepID=A0A928Z9B5_9CYAN|nr:threonine-phosphate decarboxylase CobD [Zarconia navalis]MBE9042475.1 threonine-phosphate decarboxylase [Zarconia navalis LEGE 11467]
MNRPSHGGNLRWAAAIAGCSPSDILDFSASINPLGPPKSAIAALRDRVRVLRAYPDPEYCQLRQALGKFHQLPPDWVMPGNGAAELITWAGRELASLDTTYLVVPAFGDYWRALEANNACVRACPIALEEHGEERNPSDELPVPLPPSGTANEIGLLLNNPHNPTGKLWSRAIVEPYLERFSLVVVDEAFMDFLPPHQQQSLIPQIREWKNLVVVRSLTKFYSIPGLRLGYAIAHPERLQRWGRWRDPWSVNTFADLVGVAVTRDTEFQQQTWDWLACARSQLKTGIEQIPGLYCHEGAANFLLVRSKCPSSQVQKILLERHRILIRDCLSFPELGDGYFRVAVRSREENQRLLAGLTDVAKTIDSPL